MKSKMFYSRSPCTHFKKKDVIKTIDVPFWSTIDVPPPPFLPPQLHTYLTQYVPYCDNVSKSVSSALYKV